MTNTESNMPISQRTDFVKYTLLILLQRIWRIQSACVSADATRAKTTEQATVLTESVSVSIHTEAQHSPVGMPISAPIMGYFTFPQE